MPSSHSIDTTPPVSTDPTATAAQIDGTRFLVLANVLACERHGGDRPPCGRDVAASLETHFNITLGRGVYPHLNALVSLELVEKRPAPGNVNHYVTTEAGQNVVRGAAEWLGWVLDGDADS